MDDHLAMTYEKAKRATGNSAVFKKFQNENWKRREECRSIGCVVDWYQTPKPITRKSSAERRRRVGPEARRDGLTPLSGDPGDSFHVL